MHEELKFRDNYALGWVGRYVVVDSTPCLHIIKRTVLKLAGLHHLRNFVPVFFLSCKVSLLFYAQFYHKEKDHTHSIAGVVVGCCFFCYLLLLFCGRGGGEDKELRTCHAHLPFYSSRTDFQLPISYLATFSSDSMISRKASLALADILKLSLVTTGQGFFLGGGGGGGGGGGMVPHTPHQMKL